MKSRTESRRCICKISHTLCGQCSIGGACLSCLHRPCISGILPLTLYKARPPWSHHVVDVGQLPAGEAEHWWREWSQLCYLSTGSRPHHLSGVSWSVLESPLRNKCGIHASLRAIAVLWKSGNNAAERKTTRSAHTIMCTLYHHLAPVHETVSCHLCFALAHHFES